MSSEANANKVIVKATENYQLSSKSYSISEDLLNLHEDMRELKQVLDTVTRCSVKGIIRTEINVLSARIASLHDLTTDTAIKETT
jgi:hypothetical protein